MTPAGPQTPDQAADQAVPEPVADQVAADQTAADPAAEQVTSERATSEQAAQDLSAPNLSELLGQAAWVMMRSAPHRHLFVGDLEWLLLPPIACKQFRLWRRDNMPVAFASWALLSDEVEARLIESLGAPVASAAPPADGSDTADDASTEAAASPSSQPTPQPPFAAPRLRLAPSDWQSGPNLWLVDLVCPFGGLAEAAKQLREQTFTGRAVKTVRAKMDGTGFEVGEWGS